MAAHNTRDHAVVVEECARQTVVAVAAEAMGDA